MLIVNTFDITTSVEPAYAGYEHNRIELTGLSDQDLADTRVPGSTLLGGPLTLVNNSSFPLNMLSDRKRGIAWDLKETFGSTSSEIQSKLWTIGSSTARNSR